MNGHVEINLTMNGVMKAYDLGELGERKSVNIKDNYRKRS